MSLFRPLFDTPENRWVRNHESAPWNRMFSRFTETDAMIAKLMVYECVKFSDDLLSSYVFHAHNYALRIEAILLAKLHLYHLGTQSVTIHNLFYGYLYELWVNHYGEDISTAQSMLTVMHEKEEWYLQLYDGFCDEPAGNYKKVFDHFCLSVSRIRTTDDEKVLAVSEEDLRHQAARRLTKMHMSFMGEMKQRTIQGM